MPNSAWLIALKPVKDLVHVHVQEHKLTFARNADGTPVMLASGNFGQVFVVEKWQDPYGHWHGEAIFKRVYVCPSSNGMHMQYMHLRQACHASTQIDQLAATLQLTRTNCGAGI